MLSENQTSSAESTLLSRFQSTLKTFGMESVFDDFLDLGHLSEDDLMPRLVEMGPGLDAKWDLKRMKAIVAASSLLANPANEQVVLQPIRTFAYDPASPHRLNALTALSSIDSAAASILQAEKERATENQKHQTAAQVQSCIRVR